MLFAWHGIEPNAGEIARWRKRFAAIVWHRLVRQPRRLTGEDTPSGQLVAELPTNLPDGGEIILELLCSPEMAAVLAVARLLVLGLGYATTSYLRSQATLVGLRRRQAADAELAPLGMWSSRKLFAVLVGYAADKVMPGGRETDAAPVIGVPATYLAVLNASTSEAVAGWATTLAKALTPERRQFLLRKLHSEGLRVLDDPLSAAGHWLAEGWSAAWNLAASRSRG